MAARDSDLYDFQKGEISQYLQISENKIKKFFQRLSASEDAEGTNRSLNGRKKGTTGEDEKNITLMSSENPFMSAKELQQQLHLRAPAELLSIACWMPI